MLEIKEIQIENVPKVKSLADMNRDSIGFNPRKKFEEVVEQKRGMVAFENNELVGFVIYRHRKLDSQTTLSEICVREDCRGKGFGKKLIDALIFECQEKKRDFIQLKCPIDLHANKFYEKIGFSHYQTEDGKKRQLNVWRFVVCANQKN
jgi:ribosomal protein S18 acetylase RimI-like enzyme